MKYLLDTNVFFQAANDFYRFDVFPCFWEWIKREHANGAIYSIEAVRQEIENGTRPDDKVKQWTNGLPNGFFIQPDDSLGEGQRRVGEWLSRDTKYKEGAKRKFAECTADFMLVSYGLASSDFTVVSHESARPNATSEIKIPDACSILKVPFMRVFDLLSRLDARFKLEERE